MRKQTLSILAVVVILATALLVPLSFGTPAEAAPQLAPPTPVAGITDKVQNNPGFIIFTAPLSITVDTRYCPAQTWNYDTLDLEYAINQGTVNTTTITVQYSNRLERFIDGSNVVTANAADTAGMQQFPAFGRYTCLYVNVTNSNPLSITLTAVGK